jgi:hypothetical protein
MRTTLAVILGVMALISASGCDNLYYDITDELNANYFHGTRQFVASDGAADDYFGWSVAVSSDGSTVVVGAQYDDDKGASSGSAYVYRWNGSSWVETKLSAGDGAADDRFGQGVAVSEDGSAIVVGAYCDDVGSNSNQGSVWVFAE